MQREIAHPDLRTPIKTWWHGHYDHVFIALYPFFTIRSEDQDTASDVSFESIPNFEDIPDDFDDTVKRRGEPVTWQSIHQAVAPKVPKMQFYRAVWLLSCLGFDKRANIALQKRIVAYCRANGIFLPEEDALPAILHPLLKRFLHPFEGRKIIAYDEFRDNSVELTLDLLGSDVPTVELSEATTSSGIWAIHLPDPGVLITSAFDGTDALIAMTNEAFALSDPRQVFETEDVGEDTYSDWLNPKDIFERNR
ncbi:hypothetical protein SAMN05444149_11186 [Pseudosulfitobacter pseudonitzschiae]|uniref:Uncharacterized protein n=1 Tax=Pseudosulfitobacter pseudonitzschiae TaxID=1402135 RepID=A0A073IWA9_9RHOB|nr:hypothetical protein [Pseudosulfitobacter pseudonitzschiae]KEJ94623.1 hypothetical protein SUH3_05290 [Pseudosulfitobacter pseudonitzschiae]QKS10792.1 hypothetical protein HT745_19540 [Pseudosulfitobacter pseudonitzschiae]SHG16721.1 hypothetical protein SAMN05444149_11186 [Pseudosulfitobacter pseudonitzschiae]